MSSTERRVTIHEPQTPAAIIERLSEKFDAKVFRQKPAYSGGKPMPFISHGLVTKRLNERAPGWSSRILGREIVTVPVLVKGQLQDRTYVEVTLEVALPDGSYHQEIGVAELRQDYGTAAKAAASDALKRAAMRCGVALHVWESLEEEDAGDDHQDTAPSGAAPHSPARSGGSCSGAASPRSAPVPPQATPTAPAAQAAAGRGRPGEQTPGELAEAIAEAIAAARNLAQLARIRTRLQERAADGHLSREQADSLARSLAERQSGLAALAGRRQDAAD